MVQILCIVTLTAIILAVYKKQIDNFTNRYLIAKIIKYVLFVVICAGIAFFAFFGIGEMASGDMSGAGHFIAIIPLAALALLLIYTPKKRPSKR